MRWSRWVRAARSEETSLPLAEYILTRRELSSTERGRSRVNRDSTRRHLGDDVREIGQGVDLDADRCPRRDLVALRGLARPLPQTQIWDWSSRTAITLYEQDTQGISDRDRGCVLAGDGVQDLGERGRGRGHSWIRGWRCGKSCPWVRCCAWSAARPPAGTGTCPQPANNSGVPRPEQACAGGSRPINCVTPTLSRWRTRACRWS